MSVDSRVIRIYESFKLGFCKCGCKKQIAIRNKMGKLSLFCKGHNERKNKDKYHCKFCWDKNFLIECKCKCGGILPKRDKDGILREFLFNHHFNLPENLKDQWGVNNDNWRGGRTKKGDYWYIRIDNEYVLEHVYFYEQKNKVCVMPWCVVHHIDENKENNMPWNTTTMIWGEHSRYHNPKMDRSNYRCSNPECNTPNETYRDLWVHDKNGNVLCNRCYLKEYRKNKK